MDPAFGVIQKIFLDMSDREIVVTDSSSDRTAEIARSMGAMVVHPGVHAPYKRSYAIVFTGLYDWEWSADLQEAFYRQITASPLGARSVA